MQNQGYSRKGPGYGIPAQGACIGTLSRANGAAALREEAADALGLAHNALQAAAAELLIAGVLAPTVALSSDVRVLAQAVATEALSVEAIIARHS